MGRFLRVRDRKIKRVPANWPWEERTKPKDRDWTQKKMAKGGVGGKLGARYLRQPVIPGGK